ncbi:MAG: pyruvate kinase [Elusimicrobiota bacterium]
MTKTKIICTLGPASSEVDVIRRMMLAGMDVVRLNFSHGSHPAHQRRIKTVRALNKKYRRAIKILQDLEGHRIRIGELKNHQPIELIKKQIVLLTSQNILGEGGTIPFDYTAPLTDLKKEQEIYIDDGNILLKIEKVEKNSLRTVVLIGGTLKEHKGINIPGARLNFDGITPKDKKDIQFGVENQVDYIAQSFVQTAEDILAVRKELSGRLPDCLIIAKIENRLGIKNLDKIIAVSDGIMVARGDLGVSVPIYEIPMIQKQIIQKCNQRKKFVITATQMLESMVANHRPTRAEVTDVANAILDGTDFVMLSAETAAGEHPVETVKIMNQIIKFTEQHSGKI